MLLVFILFFMFPAETFSQEKDSDYYYEQGQLLQSQGEYEKALEDYKKVLYVTNDYYPAAIAAGECYDALDQPKKAKKEYRYAYSLVRNARSLSEEERKEILKKLLSKNIDVSIDQEEFDKDFSYKKVIDAIIVLTALGLVIVFLRTIIQRIFFSKQKREKERQEKKLWIDPYWERQEERELVVPNKALFLKAIVIAFCAWILISSVRIILRYAEHFLG